MHGHSYTSYSLTMESGIPTHQQWSQIQEIQHNGNGLTPPGLPKIPGGNLQGLLQKLRAKYHISTKKKKKVRRKLKLKGRKKRYTTAKHEETSSTQSSEYSTNSFSSESETDNWSDNIPETQPGMNWTQFIEKLCSGQPADPENPTNKDN